VVTAPPPYLHVGKHVQCLLVPMIGNVRGVSSQCTECGDEEPRKSTCFECGGSGQQFDRARYEPWKVLRHGQPSSIQQWLVYATTL